MRVCARTWLVDRLARSTRDLLNTLAAIAGNEASFRSLARQGRHYNRAWPFATISADRQNLRVVAGGMTKAAEGMILPVAEPW